MRRRELLSLVLAALGAPAARAALDAGAKAPDFSASGSLGGKEIRFTLSEALKQGPVVLYFYPAAFTSGCTVEAHLFAEATDEFKALGASVVGVSTDDLATLHRFAVSECRSKFAVLSDADRRIIRAYDAALAFKSDMADRVSYLITPDARIAYQYSSLSPSQHVSRTMAALRQWKATAR